MQNGKKSKLGSILLGIDAVCVVLRLVTKGPGWTLGAVVFLLVGAIVDGASRKRYQREVRGPLVQEAVDAVFPGASYTPDSGIGYTDAREAAIEIAGGYDLVTSRDGIGGTYNGLPFQLSTVWLGLRDWFRDEETGMEREQEKEVFHGPWLLLRTAPLGGTVRLRTRTGLGKAVRLAGRKTGNAEFDQTFVIASDSDEEMQRVLSASMCERLLAVLTNSLMPCNGRFPALIALMTMFFSLSGSTLTAALLLTAALMLCVGLTFGATWLLSAPRYLLVLLPVPLALAQCAQKRTANIALTALSALAALGYLAAFALRWQVW